MSSRTFQVEQHLRNAASLSTNKLLRPVTQVELFVAFLYKLLRDLKQCFLSGAFVVEDRDQQLFKLLLQAKSRERYPGRTKAGTHRKFMNSDAMCSNWTAQQTRAACGKQFEISLPNVVLECDNGETSRRNVVLFYGFVAGDLDRHNSQGSHYVYMKLETSSYASLTHAVSASVHYGRKALNLAESKKSNAPLRREDKRTLDISSGKDYELYNCLAVQERARAYDRLLRTGDEFFVPESVKSSLLKRVDKLVDSMSLTNACV